MSEARVHLAWLLWCFNEGYVKAEDRAIMSNWMADDVDSLHPDDMVVQAELLTMADEVLALIRPELLATAWDVYLPPEFP